MDKVEFIQSYIDSCDEVISSYNQGAADKLQDEIIGVFESEITDIKNMLDNYSMHHYATDSAVDFIGDLKLLRQKLLNYVANIQREQVKMRHDLEMARLKQPLVSAHAEANPTQTAIANATANANVTIERTIKQIDDIQTTELSAEDKEVLKDYLYSLEGIKAAKDKGKFWNKAKEVLKFLADKGADAAIAAMPLVLQGMQAL